MYDSHPSDGRDCCCNCKFQTAITKHPGNVIPEHKGKCNELLGYGCAAFFVGHQIMEIPGVDTEGEIGKTNIFDSEHGICECYVRRSEPLVWVG